ncbi:tetratricopeptide repeat protein [Geobacter sp. DSM 9736]|uniref:tetratricopeptide repeat protein n=1 Tax=Geobacter sp. DSM 9736 TaxID=1277350 RepID=UPI000B4FF365|nr:tetratricopeptide repeat protein [Geobacter sp. DSM 9736]SNB45204.1 Tetratricopeptide repeat-containing protein [Geobacter sp. DSM 9736]
MFSNRSNYLAVSVIVGITILAYWQVSYNGFVSYDDFLYITQNPEIQKGFSFDSIKWAFSISSHKSVWHPLTWLSLMLDYQLFGFNAAFYHLENLALHLLNALLLFFILNRTTEKTFPSFLVAMLFAIHPINVESVAWVAERKNLLSCFFGMAAILSYVEYVRKRNIAWYILVTLFFILSLLAKPMLVTLPFLLLLLDVWPLNRMELAMKPGNHDTWADIGRVLRRAILEKAPLLAITCITCIITMQSAKGLGVSDVNGQTGLMDKVSNALVSYIGYILKMIWPAELPVFYPFPKEYPLWQVAGAFLLLAAVSFYAYREKQKRPYLLVGWLWYLGTMVPMIGLVRSGLWAAMANRYAYVPLIGIFIMVAWGLEEITRSSERRRLLVAAAAGILLALGVRTFYQVKVWKNTFTLFEYTISASDDNYIAYGILGDAYYLQRGDIEKAGMLYKKSYQINPSSIEFDIGNAIGSYEKGDYYTAIHSLKRALFKKNDFLPALFYLGKVHESLGKYDQALQFYTLAQKSNDRDTDNFKLQSMLNAKRISSLKNVPSSPTPLLR